MIQPPATMAVQLLDQCSVCGQSNQPLVVDGTGDNPHAAYHCSNGHFWMVEWTRSYQKVGSDQVVPSSSSANSASPTSLTYLNSGTPTCKGCGAQLGQPHSSICPLAPSP